MSLMNPNVTFLRLIIIIILGMLASCPETDGECQPLHMKLRSTDVHRAPARYGSRHARDRTWPRYLRNKQRPSLNNSTSVSNGRPPASFPSIEWPLQWAVKAGRTSHRSPDGLWTFLCSTEARSLSRSISYRMREYQGNAQEEMPENRRRWSLQRELASIDDTAIGTALFLLILPHIVILWCVSQAADLIAHRKDLKAPLHAKQSFIILSKPRNVLFRWRRTFADALFHRTSKKRDLSPLNTFKAVENKIEKEMLTLERIESKSYSFAKTPNYNLKDALRPHPHECSIEARIVQAMSIPRVASYQRFPVGTLPDNISFVALAQAGFMYSGEGTRVCCEDCASSFDILEVGRHPTSPRFHSIRCQFQSSFNVSDEPSSTHQSVENENSPVVASSLLSSPPSEAESQADMGSELDCANRSSQRSPRVGLKRAGGSPGNPSSHDTETGSEHGRISAPLSAVEGEDTVEGAVGGNQLDAGRPAAARRNSDFASNATPSERHLLRTTSGDSDGSGSTRSSNRIRNTSNNSNSSSSSNSSSGSSSSNSSSGSSSSSSSNNSSISSGSSGSSVSNGNSNIYIEGSKYIQDSDLSCRHFYAPDLFDTEFSQERKKPFRAEVVQPSDCTKNPGHFSYFGVQETRLNWLPGYARCSEFLRFVRLAADLTVRVVVGRTSVARAQPDISQLRGGVKFRTGTGSAIREPVFIDSSEDKEATSDSTPPSRNSVPSGTRPTSSATAASKHATTGSKFNPKSLKSGWTVVRKCASTLRKSRSSGSRHYIYIETNRHIVFDDAEAAHTTVEFFFDSSDRKGVVSLKASHILHDGSFSGGDRSLLVCYAPEADFVQSLEAKRREMVALVEKFPPAVREGLIKKVFLFHHPHGGRKIFSFGDSVEKKFLVEREPSGPPSLSSDSHGSFTAAAAAAAAGGTVSETGAASAGPIKLTKIDGFNQLPKEVRNLRKLLLYTADTCQGTSGAPVIAFNYTGKDDANGAPILNMNVWMHEGKEIDGNLNASTMEACTQADLTPPPKRPAPKSAFLTLPPAGPVVRMGNPNYPAYSSVQKRLESFSDVPAQTFPHATHHELAKAGYFYAGYGDCVRCFYCGLGVCEWKRGDDLYLEHELLLPGCDFLILQLRVMGATQRAVCAAATATTAATVDARGVASAAATNGNSSANNAAHGVANSAKSTNASPAAAQRSLPSDSPSPSSLDQRPASPPFREVKNDLGTVESIMKDCSNSSPVPHPSQREVMVYPVSRAIEGSVTAGGLISPVDDSPGQLSGTGERYPVAHPAPMSAAATATRLRLHLMQTENALLQQALTCKVCNTAPARELYLPCGHMDSCSECTQHIRHCPTCCTPIRATVKVYFA